MPYRKEKFKNGDIYHIVLRAIDENLIFKDIDDFYRGVFSIYEFNNIKPVVIRDRRQARSRIKKILKKTNKNPHLASDLRDKMVDIFAFCLMPNHFHLLVRQIKEGGVAKFMAKIGGGYGSYFNKKYSRRGHVFQNRFKAVRIKDNKQLMATWAYIHANPISLIEPKWKERGISNFKKVIEFLKKYKWSSCLDYFGEANFASVTERKLILETVGGQKKCRESLRAYLKHKGGFNKFPKLTLE